MNRRTLLQVAAGSLAAAALPTVSAETPKSTEAPRTIYISKTDNIQHILDTAPSYSTIIFNSNEQIDVGKTLTVSHPLTIRGLHAKVLDSLGKKPLLWVIAKNVAVEDFNLIGNTDNVTQEDRVSLITVQAGEFRVERGFVTNASRHGIQISPRKETGDVVGGVVRDVVGHGNSRCVVGIGEDGEDGVFTRNILVENIRCYDGRLRGAVNVKDGTSNITIRDIYAENSVYAVDVQDHSKPGQINRDVLIENVYAVKCRHAVRTNTGLKGHSNLTVRNATAKQCAIPFRISNTNHVTLENIRVLDHQIQTLIPFPVANTEHFTLGNTAKFERAIHNNDWKIKNGDEDGGKDEDKNAFPPILIADCDGVFVRNIYVEGSDYQGAAVALANLNDAVIDGVVLKRSEKSPLTMGLEYLITTGRSYTGLQIARVTAKGFPNGDIILKRSGAEGSLSEYSISNSFARIVDQLQGKSRILNNNLPL